MSEPKFASMIDPDSIRIDHSPAGRGYRLESSLLLPYPRDLVFDFFSDASNLQSITPPWLHFSILTPTPIPMQVGTLIDYRLRIHGIPLRWQSRISVWNPPECFVDEQTRGPYRRWHHEHVFELTEGGTLCRDIVEYEVHGGALIHALLVRPDLKKIFRYRREKLQHLFSSDGTSVCRASNHSASL